MAGIVADSAECSLHRRGFPFAHPPGRKATRPRILLSHPILDRERRSIDNPFVSIFFVRVFVLIALRDGHTIHLVTRPADAPVNPSNGKQRILLAPILPMTLMMCCFVQNV